MMIRHLKVWILAIALTITGAITAVASPATNVIDAFHAKLLTAMQNAGTWNYTQRREFLSAPVADTFNTETQVRLASSVHWNGFTDDEKAELVKAFYDFTLANYASRFKGYDGQDFITLGEEPMKRDRVLVSTNLVKANGEEVSLNYVMAPDAEGLYRIIDVQFKGSVSELALRRSEFGPILRDQGFTGLVSLLKQKVDKLEADALGAP